MKKNHSKQGAKCKYKKIYDALIKFLSGFQQKKTVSPGQVEKPQQPLTSSLNDELLNFTTTVNLEKYSPDFLISDGIRFATDKYDLSWFLNIICEYQENVPDCEYQAWELTRYSGNEFVITCSNDRKRILYKLYWKEDFPREHFKVLVIGSVILLPSEIS
jgi:hypothetical protein